MTIEININGIKDLEATLKQLERDLIVKKPLMRTLANTMLHSVDRNFEEEGRPKKWEPLKYRVGQILKDTGNLHSSIGISYSNTNAMVGTNVEYAPIHQFGGKAGRNNKVNIPARPFFKLTSQDEDDLLDDVRNYLKKSLNKK